jgi:hypothetical protein
LDSVRGCSPGVPVELISRKLCSARQMRTRPPFRRNIRAQGPFLFIAAIIAIVGVALVVYGVGLAQAHLGSGLIAIGAGLLLLDAGGFVVVRNPYILIGGAAGAVIILIGAALSAFGH